MTASHSAGTDVRDRTGEDDIVSLLSVFYGRALTDGLPESVFAPSWMDMASTYRGSHRSRRGRNSAPATIAAD